MLSKKFQLVKDEIDAKNYEFAQKVLAEISQEELSEKSNALYLALSSKLPKGLNVTVNNEPQEFTARKLSDLDSQPIKPGISIVSCCMNRNENLLKALKTWVKLPVDEIVIVDWSSNEPVSESIKEINDSRIKILRVEGEPKWVLTYGFNVGLRFASYSKILKFDADIEVTSNFVVENYFSEGSFVRGNWKFAVEKGEDEQKFVNGSFGACKRALKEIGYYNELITTYGWDDSDIYKRLSCLSGCQTKFINPNTIVHLEQDQEERLKHQSVNKNLFLGHFEPTEYYNMRNKYITSLFDAWSETLLQNYSLKKQLGNEWLLSRITASIDIPPHVIEDAEKYATLEMASWISPDLWRSLASNKQYLSDLLESFKSGSPREAVLDVIQKITSQSAASKLLDENLLPKLSVDKLSGSVIECEGLKHNLDIKYKDTSFNLRPATNLPNIKLTHLAADALTGEQRKLVFVTSLYDEKRQDRLEEYLYCVEQNIKVFDVLVLYYEENDSTLYNALKERLQHTEHWQKILFVIYKDRPTFEFLFDTTDILFPQDIICVANADIAADESALQIKKHLHQNAFWALSRHEVEPKSKEPEGLIMNQLGIPNTFSADMWIYQAPRKHKFKANFPIGSYHCDSFINYYVERSPYQLYNPCLDINIYHVHDPVFNSSEEKAVRDKEIIDKKLNDEIALNNGIVPLKGSKWCKLDSCLPDDSYSGTVDWYNTLIKIHVDDSASNLLQVMVSVLLAKEVLAALNCPTSIWIILPESQRSSLIYQQIESFICALEDEHIYIGVQDETRIEVDSGSYATSCINTNDLLATVNRIRAKNKGKFLDFKNEMYEFDGNFGLDYDPAYVVDYLPHLNDIDTYGLLLALNCEQLELLNSSLSNETFAHYFKPFIADLEVLNKQKNSQQENHTIAEKPAITFITSVFKGEEFMHGYLENISVAAHECNGEVIIVDANSPQNEQAIFHAFIKEHPEYEAYFTYYRLEKDPGLYNCWQYAIERAKAQYVSNANLDDRRSPFQAKALLDKLLAAPSKRGAAAAIRATTARNTSWYTTTVNQYWFTHGYDENIEFSSLYLTDEKGHVKSQNIMHCMPIWDKSLHTKYGYFDEDKYGTSADWAFWLECTKHGEHFILYPRVLSQYYINQQSHNRVNDPAGIKESKIVFDYLQVNQTVFEQQ
ncbi:glycosyltransferase family 2 protein [Aestuariirhabdus sp. LZHN29]|uniref:glycosyltransferase family 2 protein n=1 Tax=Aestuariirhabdus sp. LZHN29 TaxID=3417462 RepID=UPI003CECCC84